MTPARLAFDRVACVRGGRMLFEQVSFAVAAGGAAVVTGPNGAGKSSLLRVAAGLLDAFAGAVARDGVIGLADENAALDRDATLAKALGFWARIDGRGDRVDGALDAMGLASIAAVPVRLLSTGQRKRAGIARLIASGADIWLLDEPGNGLDAAAVDALATACAVHRGAGGIVVAATHQALDLPGSIDVLLTPFVSSEVETPLDVSPRPSTSLGTNGG